MSGIKPIRSLEQLAERKAAYQARTGVDIEALKSGANWGAGLDDEGLYLLNTDLIRRRCEK